jgi:cold shock CspA family protein
MNGGLSPPASAGQQRCGVIAFVSPEKNFAFITSQKQTKIYLHNSQFRSGDIIKIGLKVQFKLALNSKGGWRAEDCVRQEQMNPNDLAKFSTSIRPVAFTDTRRLDSTYSSICSNGSKNNIEISDKTIDVNKNNNIKNLGNKNQIDNNGTVDERKLSHLSVQPPFNGTTNNCVTQSLNKNQIDNSAYERKCSHMSAQPPFNGGNRNQIDNSGSADERKVSHMVAQPPYSTTTLPATLEKVVSTCDIDRSASSSSSSGTHNNSTSQISSNSPNVWSNMTIFKGNSINNDKTSNDNNPESHAIKIDNSNKSNKLLESHGIKTDNSNKSKKLPVTPICYMKKEYGDLINPAALDTCDSFFALYSSMTDHATPESSSSSIHLLSKDVYVEAMNKHIAECKSTVMHSNICM